jgi:hypothetical protein
MVNGKWLKAVLTIYYLPFTIYFFPLSPVTLKS